MEKLTINNEKDFKNILDNLEQLLTEPHEVEFGDLFPRTLRIVIKGKNFDGTITPSVMSGFIQIQNMLYKLYEQRHGTISASKKAELELHVSVKKGSGIAEARLDKVIEALVGPNGLPLENMTGSQLLTAIGIGAAVWLGNKFLTERFRTKRNEIDSKTKIEQDRSTKELLHHALDTVKTVCETQRKTAQELAKADSESIEIQGQKFTPKELKEYAQDPKQKSETVWYTKEGQFLVTNIDFAQEKATFIYLKDIKSKNIIKHVNIQDSRLTEDDYKIIKEALNRHSLSMRIIITQKDDTIVEARLDKLLDTTTQA